MADLKSRGLGEFIEVDLSIVRGLAYYTGPVFEVFDIGKGMRAIAGGGRYDQLVKLIGNVDMPACGFAMGDMVITDLIRESDGPDEQLADAVKTGQAADVYVIVADEEKRAEANGVVQQLRSSGKKVVHPLAPMKVGKQFQAAEQVGAKQAVIVGSEYPEITVKNLAERTEQTCAVQELIELLSISH